MTTETRPEPPEHYDRVTNAWRYLLGEDLHYGYFQQLDEPLDDATKSLTRLLASSAALKPGMRVLDIGCGTGSPALHLAQEVGCQVLGISTSHVGIDRATARAARANISDQIRFEVRDGMKMGLDDGSFDCAWVMESSHLMPRKDLLLRECLRVLRPGGRLVLCDIMLLRQIPFHEVLAIRKKLRVLDHVFGKAVMLEMLEYVRLAKEAGFGIVSQVDISRETLPTFDRWRRNSELHASVVTNLFGAESLAQFREACDILSGFWLDRLGYGLLVAERG